jgi:hypothetical protein
MPTTPIPLNQPPKNVVLALINRDNGTSFTLSQVDLTSITAMPSSFARNTSVLVEAIPGGGFLNSQKIQYYNRLDLGYQWRNTTPVAAFDNPTSTHDVLTAINTLYGIQLTADDVEDNPYTDNPHTLVAKPGSYVWIGSVDFNIVPVVIIPGLPLSGEFAGAAAPGFIYDENYDYEKTTRALVYEMLSEMTGTSSTYNAGQFLLSDLTFVNTTDVGLTLIAVADSGYTGEYSLVYHRINIQEYFDTVELPLSLFTDEDYVVDEPVDKEFILTLLNGIGGLALTAIELDIPDIMLTPDTQFAAIATMNNYLTYGSVTFTIVDDSDGFNFMMNFDGSEGLNFDDSNQSVY